MKQLMITNIPVELHRFLTSRFSVTNMHTDPQMDIAKTISCCGGAQAQGKKSIFIGLCKFV